MNAVSKKFFVSTAIDYPSAKPHAGHLYEKICADTIARFHRLKGDDVHFSTGLDCHGQKIADKAQAAGKTPAQFVDSMEPFYRNMCAEYGISFDDFIKTTEERHKIVVKRIFEKVNAKGDIYKGSYEGLYCVDCESFYTQTEAENGSDCPVHRTPLRAMEEESYFFKMSKYQPRLVKLLEETDLLWPKERRNEILQRLKEPLRDLSISRSKLAWGIPFPIDSKHVFFVWMDALVNYLSTVDYPNAKFKKFWPADAHVIGRDIVWHHTVIWWSILLSAGLPLPRVVSHGFVNTESGDKMSKAAGNVIDPAQLVQKFGPDSVRYFFLREIPFGYDGAFSEEALVQRHNNELANELGNLVSRTAALVQKKCGGKVSKQKTAKELDAALHVDAISKSFESFSFNRGLEEIFSFIGAANKYVNDSKPWALEGKDAETVLYNLCDAIRVAAILLSPVLPATYERINAQFGFQNGSLKDAKLGLLQKAVVAPSAAVLFPKLEFKKVEKPLPKARPVSLSVDSDVSKLGLKVAWGIVENVSIKKKHEGLEKLKEKTVSETKLKDRSRQAVIAEYESVYKRLHVANAVNSVRNLDGLVERSGQLPQINTAVDSYNVVSLKYGVVVGCHDLDRVQGNLRFALTIGNERYVPLGERQPKKIAPGEFAVLDSAQIVCRLDEKQCDASKVTERSKNLVFYVQGNAKTSDALLQKAASEIGELVTKYCGGTFRVN